MKLRPNKPFRQLGLYKLGNTTLVLFKRSDELAFLFTSDAWNLHGPVDYRVSHGNIYNHGSKTGFTDEDLLDTGETAKAPSLSSLIESRKG